ncbi:MAG: TldD/PmbA family protein [Candidatus Nanoarchaeia archaeon]|nr:TldD/PmbA family protein [Candidatus Nanoarchaeia archaeon]
MDLQKIIKKYSENLDFLELNLRSSRNEAISLNDGLTNTSSSFGNGHSVRALFKGAWGFSASNNESVEKTIMKAVENAKFLSKTNKFKIKKFELNPIKGDEKSLCRKNPFDIDKKEKIKNLMVIEKEIKKDDKIKSASLAYSFSNINSHLVNSFGSDVSFERTYSYAKCVVFAKQGEKVEIGYESLGKKQGYEFIDSLDFSMYQNAVNKAKKLLSSKPAPAGKFKVIMDSIMAGTFFHEAIGHACEADAVLQNNSVFKNRIGKKIGAEYVNVYDSPIEEKESTGNYEYDDEGIKSGKLCLIKNGVLENYMHSVETATRMGVEPTGNGRKENITGNPIPRMSITVVNSGTWKTDELIKDTKEGIFLKGCSNGCTDTLKGDFTFEASEGIIIRNGELTDETIKGACLMGNTKTILNEIDACTDKQIMDWSASRCGKAGAYVPVQSKCPSIRLLKCLIGGVQ